MKNKQKNLWNNTQMIKTIQKIEIRFVNAGPSSIVFKNSRISFFTSEQKIDSYKKISFAVLDEYHRYLTDKPLQASLQGIERESKADQESNKVQQAS